MGDDEHAVELVIEGDFPLLLGVADPFEGEGAFMVTDDAGHAGEDAMGACGAGADLAAEVVILVAAHAVDIMVVYHAYGGSAGL